MPARFYLLAAVIIWGWTFVASKVCLEYLSPAELLAARFVLALPFLWMILRARGLSLRLQPEHFRITLVASGLLAFHFLIQTIALVYTTATNTSWIIAISPLAMAIMAFVILDERLKTAAVVGIMVAFGGVLLLVSGGRFGDVNWLSSIGDWLALVSAFTWGLYTIASRDLSRAYPPMVITMLMMIPATLVLAAYVVATSDASRFLHMPGPVIIALLYLAILGLAVAQWFWLEGVARVGAARAGVYLYLEPLATTALAVPFLGESFGLVAAAGGLLVLGGVYYASRNGNSGGSTASVNHESMAAKADHP